jgi:hypothetical protein
MLAGISSLVSLWLAYPIDVWKINVQAGRGSSWNPDQLFAGWKTKTLHTASSSFCYFYLYSWIFSSWTASRNSKQISAPTRLVLSAIAAMLNTCATLPIDVISTRHQTAGTGNKIIDREGSEDSDEVYDDCSDDEEKKDDSVSLQYPFPESLQQRFSARVSLFAWKGLVLPCFIMQILPFTILFCMKGSAPRRRGKNNLTMMDFVGMLPNLSLPSPPIPATSQGYSHGHSPNGYRPVFQTEYRKHGLPGLYRGCNIQLLHTLLKSALLMMIRERISRTTQRILVTQTPLSTNR